MWLIFCGYFLFLPPTLQELTDVSSFPGVNAGNFYEQELLWILSTKFAKWTRQCLPARIFIHGTTWPILMQFCTGNLHWILLALFNSGSYRPISHTYTKLKSYIVTFLEYGLLYKTLIRTKYDKGFLNVGSVCKVINYVTASLCLYVYIYIKGGYKLYERFLPIHLCSRSHHL
jgi:hypothetical protein